MAFVACEYWMGLVTDHIPLAEVPTAATPQRIADAAATLHRASGRTVALCGLNPHAGEQGHLGREEQGWCEVIAQVNAAGVPLCGPLPADGLFARWTGEEAILALYHDQGLAPFKARFANRSCQVSLGLPFLRTSPDHGTAYDLAGSGQADTGSVRAALQRAARSVS
jgi:4-hydroxythreonine-4-phosphate dehydrogenase